MDHFLRIYSQRAAEYHALIAAEDFRGHLAATLKSITPLQGKRLLDVGTGSGRIPLLFYKEAAEIVAIDLQRAMLLENRRQRDLLGGEWSLVQTDMRSLPLRQGWADVTIAGWAIGHLRSWFAESWQAEMSRVLREMIRLTRPGGYVIVIETLGTGGRAPRAPTAGLAEYYNWLEDDWGFLPQEVRTDYQFGSVEEAAERIEFFFGPELANIIRENAWTRLQEWTGVWSYRVEK